MGVGDGVGLRVGVGEGLGDGVGVGSGVFQSTPPVPIFFLLDSLVFPDLE